MTTTTIEQFKEQCTDVIFEIKRDSPSYDMDQYVYGWNSAIDEAIRTVNSLPLPVMPEQAEPVYQTLISSADGFWRDSDKETFDSNVDGGWVTRTLFTCPPSALLARIAELEAENQKFTIDAQRYRHLRDSATLDTAIWEALEGFGLDTQEGYAKGIDDAIDRAILLAKSQK